LDNPNDSEDDYAADVESDIEQDIGIEDLECPEQWEESATPNVPGWIRPTQKSKVLAEKLFVTVTAMETRRNKAINTK